MEQNIVRVAENVYTVTENLGSNDSAIVTPKGVVLFDTPHKPTDAMRWRAFVESLGPTKYVIVSDHHIDHTLSASFLGGEMIATQGTRDTLLERHPTLPFMNELLATLDPAGLPLINGDYRYRIPDITVTDRLNLYMGDVEIQLIHKKGHTPNNLMAYLPKQKILFSGDNVCEAGLPSSQECCVPEVFSTLDFILEELDVETIVPGHGEICTKREALRYRDQYRAYVREIYARLRAGQSKEQVQRELRFPDYIHNTTPRYQGYPDHMIEQFQLNSVANIYDQLRRGLLPAGDWIGG